MPQPSRHVPAFALVTMGLLASDVWVLWRTTQRGIGVVLGVVAVLDVVMLAVMVRPRHRRAVTGAPSVAPVPYRERFVKEDEMLPEDYPDYLR